MKKIMNSIAVAAMMLSIVAVNAQDKAQMTKVHPDVEKYTEMYKLNDEQVKELSAIYAETGKRGMAVEKELKETQIKQRETLKTSTRSEKAKMNAETDELAKERLVLKQEREKRMIALFTDEQLELYKKNQMKSAEKAKAKPTSEKAKPAKGDAAVPLAKPVKQAK